MVTPIAAAVPDGVSLPEQINMFSGNWCVAIDMVIFFFFLILVGKNHQSHLLSADQANNTPSLSHLRGISTLRLYVII